MYTPKFNQVTERALLLEAMQSYSFAILVGPGDNKTGALTATHLPLVVKDEGEHGILLGHFAKANPHWAALADHEALVIFPGPHGYVSPSWYAEPLSVPTWNYVAVHTYGTLQLIDDDAGKDTLLKELIQVHELAYADRWRAMPEGFQRTMLAGIVGFRIAITRIEGKFKISQNRNATDRESVRAAHAAGTHNQQELARWMQRLIP